MRDSVEVMPGEAESGPARMRYDRAPGRRDQILTRVRLAGFCWSPTWPPNSACRT